MPLKNKMHKFFCNANSFAAELYGIGLPAPGLYVTSYFVHHPMFKGGVLRNRFLEIPKLLYMLHIGGSQSDFWLSPS